MADFFLYPKQEIADNLNKSAKNWKLFLNFAAIGF
jgi:hypothetical protein